MSIRHTLMFFEGDLEQVAMEGASFCKAFVLINDFVEFSESECL